jgi:hypothetical protein
MDLKIRLLIGLLAAITLMNVAADAYFSHEFRVASEGFQSILLKDAAQLKDAQAAFDNATAKLGQSRTAEANSIATSINTLTNEVDRSLENQTAVLDQAMGKVIPIRLPDGIDTTMRQLERQVADERQWPRSQTDLQGMLGRLADLVRQIPPWAEEDMLPRLTALRWSAEVIEQLRASNGATGEQWSQIAYEYQNLVNNRPDDVPPVVAGRLTQALSQAQRNATDFQLASTIAAAKRALDAGNVNELVAAQNRLSDLPAGDPTIRTLSSAVALKLIAAQATTQCDQLRRNLDRISKLSDDRLKQAGLSQVHDAAAMVILNLKMTDGAAPEVVSNATAIMAGAQAQLQKLDDTQRAAQDTKLRHYQAWAIKQIQAYNLAHDQIQQAVDAQDAQHWKGFKPHWQEANYEQLRKAMSQYLLPIRGDLLEEPVERLFSKAYDQGWKQLDDGGQQDEMEKLAEATVTVIKQDPESVN